MPEVEKVEEDVTVETVDSDDEVPAQDTDAAMAAAAAAMKPAQNRNEKKARKALSKLGLKPVPGVKRIVVKRGPSSTLFVVNQPEVLRNPGTESYVVYGMASTAGDEQAQLAQAAQQFNPEMMKQMLEAQKAAQAAGEGAGADDGAAAEDEEEADETGLVATDIELVMDQAKVSRAKAANTLRANDGDVVNTIMELTM